MTQVAEGVIGFIKENPTQRGLLYSFVLNDPGAGKDVKGTWYNCGQNKPPAEKGSAVKFAYTTNSKGYHDADITKFKVTGSAPPKTHNGGGAKKYAAAGGRDDYWAKKEERDLAVTQPMIMFQNATTNAVNVVTTGFQTGTLDLGKTKAKQVPNLMILVTKIRDELFAEYIAKQQSLAAGEPAVAFTEDETPQLEDEAVPVEEEQTVTADDDNWDAANNNEEW